MTIQALLDQEAIDMLPETKKLIYSYSNKTERGNITASALRRILNNSLSLIEMNESQLNKFDKELAQILYKIYEN